MNTEKLRKQLIEDGILKTKEEMNDVRIQHLKDRGIINPYSIMTSVRTQVAVFLEEQPIFYDKSKLFWKWNEEKHFYERVDETQILLEISKAGKDTINSKSKAEIMEALKQEGRKRIPLPFKKEWLQFKNEIINIKNGTRIKANEHYFCTNPIPWNIGKSFETPIIDKIFEEWVGKEYKKTLYQIIAYCMIPDYPIHRIFCFIGSGLNGKSKFLELLRKFVGENNICSTELDILLKSRFEITKLHKKLVCMLGETNFNELSKTSILKRLTGGDTIGFEYKNKDAFDDYNYAKILISTNNLPTTTDKTIGFYRRWMIIDFPNSFNEKKDILNKIPNEEFENLAYRSIIELNNLLENREFHNEGSINERMKKFEEKSDPLGKFLKEFTTDSIESYITKRDFSKKFHEWCVENRFRTYADNTLGRKMKELGYEQTKKYADWLYDGKGGQIRVWDQIKWVE
ncbi:hypothetical protein GF374_01045 [Candidatus Woesearchaeota archaeon]|nr:hypothetical protein [Candidatus Woesearchaeota archaeon]